MKKETRDEREGAEPSPLYKTLNPAGDGRSDEPSDKRVCRGRNESGIEGRGRW